MNSVENPSCRLELRDDFLPGHTLDDIPIVVHHQVGVFSQEAQASLGSAAWPQFGLASLRNLDLPATGAVVIAAPLKIVNGSGSPLRVLALVEESP